VAALRDRSRTTRPHTAQVLLSHEVEPGPSGLIRQRQHNVGCFLSAVERMLPHECAFSPSDLDADDEAERPRVAECVLLLRAAAAAGAPARCASPSAPPATPALGGDAAASPPFGGSSSGAGSEGDCGSGSSIAEAGAEAASRSPVASTGAAAAPAGEGPVQRQPSAEPCTPRQWGLGVLGQQCGPGSGGGGGGGAAAYALPAPSGAPLPEAPLSSRMTGVYRAAADAAQQIASVEGSGPEWPSAPAMPSNPGPPAYEVHGGNAYGTAGPSPQAAPAYTFHQSPVVYRTLQCGGHAPGTAGLPGPAAGGQAAAAAAAAEGPLWQSGSHGSPGHAVRSLPQIMPSAAPAPYLGAGASALAGLGPRGGGVPPVAGVTRLMQQCSSMLRDRMYMSGAGQMGGVRASYSGPATFDPQEVRARDRWVASPCPPVSV
jgi:hypothetical protein